MENKYNVRNGMICSIVGDALKTNTKLLAHQVNCKGVMGAGIALQIKEKLYNKMAYSFYSSACEEYGSKLLGHVIFLPTTDGRMCANVFGENVPTGQGLDTNYEALRIGLQEVYKVSLEKGWDVTIPGLMGCGLAGGDWNYVLHNIIEPIFADGKVSLTIAYFSQDDFEKYVLCKQ